MNTKINIENIARICHEANRALCIALGDFSQPHWEDAPDWQRNSACEGVKVIVKDPFTTPTQLHEKWSEFKIADGWVFGSIKDPVTKTHPCLVPYTELPAEQQWKDAIFGSIVRTFLC